MRSTTEWIETEVESEEASFFYSAQPTAEIQWYMQADEENLQLLSCILKTYLSCMYDDMANVPLEVCNSKSNSLLLLGSWKTLKSAIKIFLV